MRALPLLVVLFLVGCVHAQDRLTEPGCLVGSSHVGQTCGGTTVHGDTRGRDDPDAGSVTSTR